MAKHMSIIGDADARQAALDTSNSFIVQAPAGSGKTGLLTQRYLALLGEAGEPEDILAITFTHKASGEMRSRIFGSLQRALQPEPPESAHEQLTWELARAVLRRDADRGWRLLETPGRLRIQTIDSLCASLTRQMPLLSRFGGQPSVAEDASYLYREAARKTLMEIESGETWSTPIEHLLRHLDNNLMRVEELLASMLERRDHWLRHIADRSDERVQRHALEAVLHDIIREHLAALKDTAPAGLRDEIVALAVYAAGRLAEQGGNSDIRFCSNLKAWPGDQVAHVPVWRGLSTLLLTGDQWRKRVDKNIGFPPVDKSAKNGETSNGEYKERMQQLLARLEDCDEFRRQLAGLQYLPEPVFSETQWDILQAMIELLPIAVAQLRLVFGAHGTVDFSEIAQSAVTALGSEDEPTDLALALDYRIHHILVDEFQDTSLSQYQLLERLTAGWAGEPGRTLFLVGDPMQSIYRFREAEVALYLRARQRGIGGIGLTPLNLSVNFRSQRPLIDWFNQSFKKVFPLQEDLTTGAVAYAASEPFHQAGLAEAVNLYPAFDKDSESEAQQIAGVIQQIRAERPDDTIAVLVRARSHLTSIVAQLNEAKIAYRAVEIEHLGKRQPVIDLMSLTRAMQHLADRVAWIAVLRAPWCGLTLLDIETLLNDPQQLIWQSILKNMHSPDLSDDGRTRLARLVDVLSHAFQLRQRVALTEWVQGTWRALSGPATLPESRDLRDCERYFQLLASMEERGTEITIGNLEQQVDRLFAATDAEADDRLQVMTIHKAKGLEFDSVILPGLGRRPSSRNTQLLTWAERAREDDRSELILAPIAASSEDSDAMITYLRYLDGLREQNEVVRLLYVAATRAKKSLHLFGNARLKKNKDGAELLPPTAGSLLATLWPAVEPQFAEAFRHLVIEEADKDDKEGAGYRDVQGITRISDAWRSPVHFDCTASRLQFVEQEVEYSWVGAGARHVGTVVHHMLEQLVLRGRDSWSGPSSEILKANVANELLRLGVPLADIDASVIDVLTAIEKTLSDDRGRWLLDNSHQDSRCEYALVSYDDQRGWSTSVIDRTFIDERGVRWIIDYKTSTHSGGGLEVFLDREQQRYREQLDGYARILSTLDQRPIRLGLYFPLLGGWREWEYL